MKEVKRASEITWKIHAICLKSWPILTQRIRQSASFGSIKW